ncbi:MAG: hypothetical protein HYU56_02360 [Candidatus Aenigmarchaeota archaeon]|nr:hypothetical protein [Candidatus Aenigmarchaeota archaeon]
MAKWLNRKLLFALTIVVLLISVVLVISSQNETELPAEKAYVTVKADKTVKSLNKQIFGTAMPGEGRGNRSAFTDAPLKEYMNELQNGFMTLQGTSAGFPFYPEMTGEHSKRMTIAQILDRMKFRDDPDGAVIYETVKDEPALNKPMDHNYDDILQYLESLKAKPKIAIRVPTYFTGLGDSIVAKMKLKLDPKTGSDLVHYLNDPPVTELGRLRARNGHPEPYNVKYFVLGNEMWNNYVIYGLSLEDMAAQHIAFATAMKAADPTVKIGFSFADDGYPHEFFKPEFLQRVEKQLDFNDRMLSLINGYFDFGTYHVYSDGWIATEGKEVLDLGPQDWKFLMGQAYMKEKYGSYQRHREIVQRYNPSAEVINDEYSGPLADLGGALFAADHVMYLIRTNYDSYAGYWDSGLFEPLSFFGMIHIPDEKSPDYFKRPAFYALKMFNYYTGDFIVESIVKSPTYHIDQFASQNLIWPAEDVPSVAVMATKKDNKLYIMLLNRETNRDMEVEITLESFVPKGSAKIYTLTGQNMNSNNENNHNNVVIQESSIQTSTLVKILLKKHSLVAIVLEQ